MCTNVIVKRIVRIFMWIFGKLGFSSQSFWIISIRCEHANSGQNSNEREGERERHLVPASCHYKFPIKCGNLIKHRENGDLR